MKDGKEWRSIRQKKMPHPGGISVDVDDNGDSDYSSLV
jgi:hypothetical protein